MGPDSDIAAVVLHGVLDDRQSEAGAAGVPRASLIDPEESFENPVLVFFGDALALVCNGDLNHTVGRAHPDSDPGTVRRILNRVRDEVVHCDGEKPFIAVDLGVLVALHCEFDLTRLRGYPVLVDSGGDRGVHANQFCVGEGVGCLQARQLDDVLGDTRESGRIPH